MNRKKDLKEKNFRINSKYERYVKFDGFEIGPINKNNYNEVLMDLTQALDHDNLSHEGKHIMAKYVAWKYRTEIASPESD